jgi:hypothetical protein
LLQDLHLRMKRKYMAMAAERRVRAIPLMRSIFLRFLCPPFSATPTPAVPTPARARGIARQAPQNGSLLSSLIYCW